MSDVILLAPDALKGSLSNVDVADAMESGLLDAGIRGTIVKRPLADGGDGTINAFRCSGGGRLMTNVVHGPYSGMSVSADWWLCDDGVAVIEMARAAGITLSDKRDPMTATTLGVGQLIRAAQNAGAREIWIGGGGSATVDGGTGLLAGLGFEMIDSQGQKLQPGGKGLVELARIKPPLDTFSCPIKMLCDVDNPAVGPRGAAAVFGPQKGASPQDVEHLERGLKRLCSVIDDMADGSSSLELTPFGGAAGGLGVGLSGLLNAQLHSGFDTIYDRLQIGSHLEHARVALTAEGQIDGQTQSGKTVAGVFRRAAEFGCPVWAFAGRVTLEAESWCPPNGALIPIVDGPISLEEACVHASSLVRRAVFRTSNFARLADFWTPPCDALQ